MATPAEEYAALLNRKIGKLPEGGLRFWGKWFGRPFDSSFTITGFEAQSDLLNIRFAGGGSLSVWSPSGLEASASVFRIAKAERVRFEWYYQGRSQTPENLCFEEYVKGKLGYSADTPAVEIVLLELSKPTGFALALQVLRFFRAYLAQKRC
jgi:hypothetical protein